MYDAVRRTTPLPSARTKPMRPGVSYDRFKEMAWLASQQIEPCSFQRRGIVLIPRLRRALHQLPAPMFNQHLLRLERNGLVYLVAPDNVDALSEEERRECLPHPSGDLRSFVLWMSPRVRAASFWD
jgi:hypothetical protein